MKRLFSALLCLSLALGISGCSNGGSEDGVTTVTIGVVGEYNDQFDVMNELLEDDGIHIELKKYTDYASVNRALNDGEIDMNAFQHKAYLKNDIETFNYDITSIGDTIIAPLSIYNNKDKISSVEDIKDGDTIYIPSDATNGGRALKLLEAAGLIVCDPEKGYLPTKLDIVEYKVDINIVEGESATLSKLLPDGVAAVINGGNAFTAGLNPTTDAIFTENVDPETNPYVSELVNILAVRTEDKDNPVYQKVVEAYHTDEVKQVLQDSYDGAFLPVW